MLKSKTLRGFQSGLEPLSAQGTPVTANRSFKNGTMKPPKRRNNVKQSRSEGHKSATGQQRGKRFSEWGIDGQNDYNLLPYWAAMIYDGNSITPTTIAAGAYQYSAVMSSTAVDTPLTMTFEYGNNQGSNSRMSFCTATDFTYKIGENGCDYGINGFGAYPTKNITLTPTPTKIAQSTMHFTDYRVNYSTTFTGLSSGKLLTSKEIEFNMKNKYRYSMFIDDATASIGGIMEKQPDITGSITVAQGSESDIFLGNLETSVLGYLQIQATGSKLVSGTPNYYCSSKYTLAIYVDDEEETENQDLYAGKYTFYSGEDDVNGDASMVTVCGLASL